MLRILTLLLLVAICFSGHAQPTTAPALVLDKRLKPLPLEIAGPFVRLGDGGILAMNGTAAMVSHDEGITWQTNEFLDAKAFKIRPEYALIRTRSNTIVCVFINDSDKLWKWDAKAGNVSGEARLFVYVTRSSDEGKTWSPPVKIQDGYCGAIRDIIQSRDGTLIVPSQIFLTDKARHATVPIYSTDDGATWHTAGLLDVGGHGHHDGSIEPTVVERNDGSIWMLLRTTHDMFYESISQDSGRSWSVPAPTKIDASSSPAMVKRLKSGQLIMAWNRLYPEGQADYPRRGDQHSERAASWQREELVLAFSNDDGKTWTPPQIIAKAQPRKWVAYPFFFEITPGTIWLTTMQGGLRAELQEADFASDKK